MSWVDQEGDAIAELLTYGNRATICSVFKTVELHTVFTSQDPTWDGVDVTIWSQSELSLGILIASLPPLRKALIKVFRRVLPGTETNSRKTRLYGYGHSTNGHVIMDDLAGSKAYHSRARREEAGVDGDDDSDRAILADNADSRAGILKSTTVTVEAGCEPDGAGRAL